MRNRTSTKTEPSGAAVDATRCGGYAEWLRAAAVAAAHGLQVSGHCAPHLHASVAAATPDLRHLEWFHDHVRIETTPFTHCRHGRRLDRAAAEPFAGRTTR